MANCKKLCWWLLNFIFLIVVWDFHRRLGKLANPKAEASDVQAFPHVLLSIHHGLITLLTPKKMWFILKIIQSLMFALEASTFWRPVIYHLCLVLHNIVMHSLVKSKGKSPFVILDLVFVLVSFYKVRFGTTLLMSRIASKRRCAAVAFDKNVTMSC